MANPIVQTNTTVQVPPAPSTLQSTGAFISQGGTTLSSNTTSLLTSLSSLSSILAAPLAVTSIAWATGTATVTTTAAHGIATGDTFLTTISGATPANYNGTFLATATGASTFTYALASDGGTTPATGTIKYTPRNVAELVAMNATYWAQGANQSVYVMELGAGEPSAGITALGTYLTSNPNSFYAFLIPRSWDGQSGLLALGTEYNSPNSKGPYFFTTTTTGTYTDYTSLMKPIWWIIEPSGINLAAEFHAAVQFQQVLASAPSTTNKVAPFQYRFAYGVTPWTQPGNGTIFAEIQAAGGNYILLGSQAGVSNAMVVGGQFADGNPVNYWYAADWMQINGALNVANAVVNGSNNPVNPLYYNQPGINALEQVLASTASSGVTFGMVLNPVIQLALDGPALSAALNAGTYSQNTIVNAVPFPAYTKENPSDYSTGKYAGLSCEFVPLRGFDKIVFNIVVSFFPS